jgi:hypothetical protein
MLSSATFQPHTIAQAPQMPTLLFVMVCLHPYW